MLTGFIGMPGPTEMLIIGIIAVLPFGTRLPKVARSMGSSIVEFKKGLNDIKEPLEEATKELNEVVKK